MQWVCPLSELTKGDVMKAGGKGASLGEMIHAGTTVPPGFVITAQTFDHVLALHGATSEIEARCSEMNIEDMNSVERTSEILRAVVQDIEIPEDIQSEIYDAYTLLDADWVAVRSSATAEDGATASWAGELETYLNTPRELIIEHMKKCWASLFTPRALFYRFEKKLSAEHISVAVVIQQMIQSEVAGVAFTVHPVTEDHDQMIIEAVFGLGEALVGGHVTPDSYILSKKSRSILEMHIGGQKKKLVRGPEGNVWVDLGDEGKIQKVPEPDILTLADLCKKIEIHYGFPCDIEWAYQQGKWYMTQSRPITTLKK